ncbi:MAG: hypothetical protein RLZZ292_2671, partial [Bacteroidota bacterium]
MQTNCLTETQFMRYLNDEVTSIEARQIDRHLAHCALCSDAIEGAMSVQPTDFQHTTHQLDNKFKTTPVMREKTLQLFTQPSRKMLWGIAASFALVVTAASAYYYSSSSNKEAVATVITTPTASDSITTTETTPTVNTPIATPTTTIATPIVAPNSTTFVPAPSAITRDTVKANPTTSTAVVTVGAAKPGSAIVTTSPVATSADMAVAETKKETVSQESKDKNTTKVSDDITQRPDPTGSYQGASNS